MSLAHVFVCYGAVSLDAAGRIAGTLEAGPDEIYFLNLFSGDGASVPRGVHCQTVDVSSYSEWKKPFAIARSYREFSNLLDDRGVHEIVAYVPHPFELPSNDLIYSNPRVVRRELLPDGLINFTCSNHIPDQFSKRVRYAVRVALRRLSARASGFLYRPLGPGHITQYHVIDYDRHWTDRTLGYTTTRTDCTALPSRCGNPQAAPVDEPKGISVLVLDQELRGLADRKLEGRLRQRLIQIVNSLAADRIYYKAHPRGLDRAASMPPGTIDLTSPEGAESVIERTRPTHLVGFYSTPLLLAPEEVSVRIAVLPDGHATGLLRPELAFESGEVLRQSGVRVESVL